jgi:hypothetical protein
MAKPALGRGLSALLGGKAPAVAARFPGAGGVDPVGALGLPRWQEAAALADSIREQGILAALGGAARGSFTELIAG